MFPLGFVASSAVALAALGCGSSSSTATDAKASDARDASSADLHPAACVPAVVTKTNDLNGVPAPYVIADFTYALGDTASYAWGFNGTDDFSGAAYIYPTTITQDISASDWHVTGMVGDYAGLGLGFRCQTDFSMFTGISFTIKGNVGPSSQMLLTVGTAPNDVNKVEGAASLGRCVPVAGEYDGTCLAPRYLVPVSAAATTVKLKWADLKQGKPQDSVDPKAISVMSWAFDWIGGATPFLVDVTIDDVILTID